MISLAHPVFLLVGGILLLPYVLRPQRAWYYSSLPLLHGGKPSSPSALLTSGVTLAALLLLLLALARPQGGAVRTQHVLEARDIVLTLDLSLSMDGSMALTGDEKNVRKLDLIQRAALAFVRRHQQDRLGLIVFGDDAFGAWPLSTDSPVLQQRLQHLETLLPSELRGTRVEKALVKSLHHLQELGQARSKMVLLLTDGLDTIDPTAAGQIGFPGAPPPPVTLMLHLCYPTSHSFRETFLSVEHPIN